MITALPAIVTAPGWKEIAPGVWRTLVGRPDRPTLTEASDCKPRRDRLRALPKGTLPFDLSAIHSEANSENAIVRLPLAPGERIFGLGLQMSGVDRRGGVYHLRVDHYSTGHDRLHAPTPLYVSSLGYAVFFNTIRPLDIYVGIGNRLDDPKLPVARDRNLDPKWQSEPDSGKVEASVRGKGLEVLVITGPTALAALQRYNLLCGGGPMPPAWALGFWHRTPSLASSEEVLGEICEYEKRGFPLDVVGLEPGWQSRAYPGSMEWSPERFPTPRQFVERAKLLGVRVNLWENPYVAPHSTFYEELKPNFGSHTVWLGAVPDILNAATAKIVRDFHRVHHVNLGVSGYKIDEIDGFDVWLWPDHATFPSGLDGLRMRQIYGLLWQRELDRLFREKGERTFGLVRGSNGAASRFPFAIYSDTYDFNQYVTASTNAPLAGVLWCAEVRDAKTGEEWVRRMQSACLSPIAQLNAWASGTKPWSFPDVESEVRHAMLTRNELFPYLYTTFSHYWRDGIPPIRPMALVDGGVETDQYMLGNDLIVAPLSPGQLSRQLRLPAGQWFDYETGELLGGGKVVTIHRTLSQLPLYVRSGAAIPTIKATLHISKFDGSQPFMLKCFGPGPWEGFLYQDDGHTFAFESGDFSLERITVSLKGEVNRQRIDGNRKGPISPLIIGPKTE